MPIKICSECGLPRCSDCTVTVTVTDPDIHCVCENQHEIDTEEIGPEFYSDDGYDDEGDAAENEYKARTENMAF